jgi:hypothetical protein
MVSSGGDCAKASSTTTTTSSSSSSGSSHDSGALMPKLQVSAQWSVWVGPDHHQNERHPYLPCVTDAITEELPAVLPGLSTEANDVKRCGGSNGKGSSDGGGGNSDKTWQYVCSNTKKATASDGSSPVNVWMKGHPVGGEGGDNSGHDDLSKADAGEQEAENSSCDTWGAFLNSDIALHGKSAEQCMGWQQLSQAEAIQPLFVTIATVHLLDGS